MTPVCATQQLGRHRLEGDVTRDGVVVVAIGGVEPVVLAQQGDDADRGGLLAVGGVRVALEALLHGLGVDSSPRNGGC